MNILFVTNMYPTPTWPAFGIFVKLQVDSLEKRGIKNSVISMDGRNNKVNYLKGFLSVRQAVKGGRYDLLHAHYGYSGVIAMAQRSIPVVVTLEGSDIFSPRQRWISLIGCRNAHAVIVQSKQMHTLVDHPNCHILPNGINVNFFKPADRIEARKKLNIDLDLGVVLFVGNPGNKVKNFKMAEEAVRIVAQKINKKIVLVPLFNRSQETMPLYYNAADCLLITSLWEGSPNMVKEAMGCNLPIVSVDVGDVKEIVGDTELCFVGERSVSLLAERVENVLLSGKRANGRDRIMDFSLERVAEKIENIYRSILSST